MENINPEDQSKAIKELIEYMKSNEWTGTISNPIPSTEASIEEWEAYKPTSYTNNYGKKIVLAEKRRDLQTTKEIGERLKAFREQQGLSQLELGSQMTKGYGLKPTVHDIENGSHTPTVKQLIRLVEKFNLNPLWLLTGNGNMYT